MKSSYGMLLRKRVSQDKGYDFMFLKQLKDGEDPLEKVKKVVLDSIVDRILVVESLIKVDNVTGFITEQSVIYEGTQLKFEDNNSYMPMCDRRDISGKIVCSVGDGNIYYFHSRERFLDFFKLKVLCKFELNWITEFNPIQRTSASRKVVLVKDEFELI